MLGVNGATDSKGRVELYERGYGKDAAGIAREAIAYGESDQLFLLSCPGSLDIILTTSLSILIGRDNDFDVVLIDTAGRMQDNEVSGVATPPSAICYAGQQSLKIVT